MKLTTKLRTRVEHQADYNCDKFQGRRLNESKDTEVKQRDLWETSETGGKRHFRSYLPLVLTDQRQMLNIAVSDQKLAEVQNLETGRWNPGELLPKAFKWGSNIWEGVFPGQ